MSMQTNQNQDKNLWEYIKPSLPNWGSNSVVKGIGNFLSKPFEALGRLEGETLKGNAIRQNISQWILPNEIGGYTATKAEREKASKKISMGRALAFRIEDTFDHVLGRNINTSVMGMANSYDPKTGQLYNVYKEGKREKYYSQLGVRGNLITGSFDLVAGSMASPLLVLGKLGKLGKQKALENKITTNRVVKRKDLQKLEKAEQELLNYLNAKNQLDALDVEDITITGRTADDIINERAALESALPALKKASDKATEDLSKIEYANGFDEFIRQSTVLNSNQLIKHRVVKESSDPELLAGLLGETTDVYQAALIVRAAAGDIKAQRLLAAESTSTFMALQNALKPLGDITDDIKVLKQADGDLSGWGLRPENGDMLADEFADLVRKDTFLWRAVQAADQKVLEGRMGSSIFTSVESFRAAKAKVFAEVGSSGNRLWNVEYFRRNPFVATVAVVTWPFRERPSGFVRTKGINSSDSVREVEAFLSNVRVWDNADGVTKRQDYIKKYLAAGDEISKEQLIRRMEEDAIRATAEKYGVSVKDIDEIVARLDRDRGNTIKFYKERGFLLDHNNNKVYAPQLKTQLADSVPMVDIVKLDKLLGARAKVWQRSAAVSKDMLFKPLDILDEFWRPIVLMRLGYTQRNVFEGWGRGVASLGFLTGFSTFAKPAAFANWARNRHAGLLNAITMRRSVLEADKLMSSLKGTRRDRIAPFRASWSRVIELQDNAIEINKAQMLKLEDELKEIVDSSLMEVDSFTVTRRNAILDELSRRKDFEKEAIAQLRQYVKMSKKKGIKGNRYRVGQGFFSYRGYDDLPKTFEGDFGDVLMELAGSQSRTKLELTSSSRVYTGMDNGKYRSGGFTRVEPTDDNYFAALERVVNRQFRNSPVMMMVLRGDSPDAILAYLKTQKGRKEMRAVRKEDPEIYTLELIDVAERYIPDAALRATIARKELTAGELAVALKGRPDLRPIHGDKIEEITDLTRVEKYNKFVRDVFRYIGALPEDVFVRHPFANTVFMNALKDSIDNAKKQGVKLTSDEIDGIIAGARRKALQETRRTLYTIERYSNLAHLTRFLEPFFMAAQNTAQVWSKLAYRDPSLFAYAGYIYTAPDRAGMVQTDELTGREIVTMQVPDWMRKGPMRELLASVDSVSFEKGGANLILQGSDWWRIGDGPIAQIAASEFAKKYPTTQFRPILDYVIPFGPSRSKYSIDILKPALWKRISDALQETDSKDYGNSLILITQIENNRYRRGERDEPTALEIKERTDAFTFLRVLSSATMPVSFKFRSEFQFYVDKARLYREKYGPDASTRFYQDFPDYFEFFFSISKNPTGMEPTKDAVRYLKKYQGLVDKITDPKQGFEPEFLTLITNSYGSPSEFDNTAYSWQFLNSYRTGSKETIRSQQGADDVVTMNSVQRGWIEYNAFMELIEQNLKARPGDLTIQSKGAEDLANSKRLYIENQKRSNPAWYATYNDPGTGIKGYNFVRAVQIVLKDKKFMADRGQEPVWDAFNEYIKNRKMIVDALKARKAAGGSDNIRAKSNEKLAIAWDLLVQDIKAIDPTGAFSNYYNRFLENDTFEEVITNG